MTSGRPALMDGSWESPVADQIERQPTTMTSVIPAPTPEGTNANKCISAPNVKIQPQNVDESRIRSRYVWKWRVGLLERLEHRLTDAGGANNGKGRQRRWTEQIALTDWPQVRMTTERVSSLQNKETSREKKQHWEKTQHHRSQQWWGLWAPDPCCASSHRIKSTSFSSSVFLLC